MVECMWKDNLVGDLAKTECEILFNELIYANRHRSENLQNRTSH